MGFFEKYYQFKEGERELKYGDRWEFLICYIGAELIAKFIGEPPDEKCYVKELKGHSFNDGEYYQRIVSWPITNWDKWKDQRNIHWDLHLLSDGDVAMIEDGIAARLHFTQRGVYGGYDNPNYHMDIYDALSSMAIGLGIITEDLCKFYRKDLVDINQPDNGHWYRP